MSKGKSIDELRDEYRRENLGRGVRGKFLAKVARGTNLVVLEDKVAKAFPSSVAVNEALKGLLNLTEANAKQATSASVRAKTRR